MALHVTEISGISVLHTHNIFVQYFTTCEPPWPLTAIRKVQTWVFKFNFNIQCTDFNHNAVRLQFKLSISQMDTAANSASNTTAI